MLVHSLNDDDARLANLQLSLFGEWELDNNSNIRYFFVPDTRLTINTNGDKEILKYEAYIKDGNLRIRIMKQDNNSELNTIDYEVVTIDKSGEVLILKNDKQGQLNFHLI